MPERSTVMSSLSGVAISSGPGWSSQLSTHEVYRGRFVPVLEKSHRSRARLPRRPELFPHTERANHPVEHVLNIYRSNQLLERADSSPEMDRRHGGRKFLPAPGTQKLVDSRAS